MARGNSWDAPIHGEAFEVPAIPAPMSSMLEANKSRSINFSP